MYRPEHDKTALPHAPDAERAILGDLLLDDEHAVAVAELLGPADFYVERHRIVFESMLRCIAAGGLDYHAVASDLQKHRNFERVNGHGFLSELDTALPDHSQFHQWVAILKDRSARRVAIAEGRQLVKLALDGGRQPEDIIARIGQAQKAVEGVAPVEVGGFRSMREVMLEAQDMDPAQGISFEFDRLERWPMAPGNLIIVAARPGHGKSAFAVEVGKRNAEAGKRTAAYALEMTAGEIGLRLISAEARIPHETLRLGHRMTPAESSRYVEACRRLERLPLKIDDSPYHSVHSMSVQARRLQREHGLDLLIVDYLQLVQAAKAENRQTAVQNMSRGLKMLAKELEIPVILLAQLKRTADDRPNHRPQLSDLRESGAIEQDADMVCFIVQHSKYAIPGSEEWNEADGKAEFIIAKCRGGEANVGIDLAFDGPYIQFGNLEQKPFESTSPAASRVRSEPEQRVIQ